jgi:hypothetical protein
MPQSQDMAVVIPGHVPMNIWPDVLAVAQVQSMESSRYISNI